MKSEFVHLHLHTEYSLLDGVGKIDDYLNRAKELSMTSLAITDHGNMFGAIEFYQKALNKGIKPIIGMEAYIAKDMYEKEKKSYHLVLLAKNITGYKNLVKLSSKAYLEGFYYRPRIDRKLLRKYSEGLIALSACMNGEIPKAIEDGIDVDEIVRDYIDIFKDDFYIELQNNGFDGQIELNEKLFDIAKKYNVKTVATNDVHYVHSGEHFLQDIVVCIQTGAKLSDTNRMKIDSKECYFKSYEQMKKALPNYLQAIENTKEIADKCNLNLKFGEFKFPEYKLDGNSVEDINAYLENLVRDGLKKRYAYITEEIQSRADYELNIIKKMGYSQYFVVVWDLIKYAKSKNIPVGPGRGSAAGSLVSYALHITELDPLKYNLIFERFLNPERVSMPDIDIDICQERRPELIEYVSNKYGKDKVAQIITFGRLKARAALRDVGRVMDISLWKVDKIAKLIPFNYTLTKALKEIKEIQKIYDEDVEIQSLMETAKKLETKVRHASIHAAGIVITKDPLTDEVPLYSENHENISTQYQMKELEDLGLLKMDFLGLRNLTILQKTLESIDKKIDLYKIPLTDEKTYRLLSKGDALGVFQLESTGIRKLLKKLNPDKFEDLIAVLALYRPGPLGSGMVDDFINIKNGQKAHYPHPSLKNVLEETYGVILYQEQVMKIANIMANYTLGEADLLRRAMGKKKIEIMNENRLKFINRSIENGYTKEKATEIFNLIDKFAGYGFNKSHSAAYALIAYWTAYFKANYTLHYYGALMTSERNNVEKIGLYIADAKAQGIKISLPNVNKASTNFIVDSGKLLFGMSSIKNIGEGTILKIIEEKEKNGEYKDFIDFIVRNKKNGVNKKVLEALVKSGSTDSLPGNRHQKFEVITQALDYATKISLQDEIQQMNLFDEGKKTLQKVGLKVLDEYKIEKKLNDEKEFLGVYFSAHPLDKYKEILKYYRLNLIKDIKEQNINHVKVVGRLKSIKKRWTKTDQQMASFVLEDYNNTINGIIFPNDFIKFGHLFQEGNLIYIEAGTKLDTYINEKALLVRDACLLDDIAEVKSFKIYILIEKENKHKLTELKQLILSNKGRHHINLVIDQNGQKEMVSLGSKYTTNANKTFILKVVELLGEKKIVIK